MLLRLDEYICVFTDHKRRTVGCRMKVIRGRKGSNRRRGPADLRVGFGSLTGKLRADFLGSALSWPASTSASRTYPSADPSHLRSVRTWPTHTEDNDIKGA